jgi:hypothetical protein
MFILFDYTTYLLICKWANGPDGPAAEWESLDPWDEVIFQIAGIE